jgi:transforming growth factor-beta-induced protein
MNKKIVFWLVILVSLCLVVSGRADAQGQDQQQATQAAESQTVYETIQSEPQLDSFETLIEAAGLRDELQDGGPFTVFAPVNSAWADYAVTADGEQEAAMTNTLLYHVLNGRYPAAAFNAQRALPTLAGEYLFFDTSGAPSEVPRTGSMARNIILNDGTAYVIGEDIQATNGVVYIIDAVVPLPEENSLFASKLGSPEDTIPEVLMADGRFGTFLSLLDLAGLTDLLEDTNASYTVFAPTDEAFAAVPEALMNEWLTDVQGALKVILTYHIVGDRLSISQIATDKYIPTLEGRGLAVMTDDDIQVHLNGRPIQSANVLASNGVIHVVDEVILP